MKKQINEFKRMQQLAGITNESQLNENLPSDFKLLSKKKEKNEFGSKDYVINYEFLINDENYTTSSGLKFNLKTTGYIMLESGEKLDWNKYPKFLGFYYIKTDVYHNGKQLTKGSGIPGLKRYGGFDIAGSIKKAKKWLDINGDDFASGKKQYIIPST